ncbi:MAG: tetratricopeptide repeat protein [Planctomycetota bacterium]
MKRTLFSLICIFLMEVVPALGNQDTNAPSSNSVETAEKELEHAKMMLETAQKALKNAEEILHKEQSVTSRPLTNTLPTADMSDKTARLIQAEKKMDEYIIPAKFVGNWIEQQNNGNIVSELKITAESIEWKRGNENKAVVVTVYTVEDNNQTIAYDESVITRMSVPTGANIVSGTLNVDTGVRKVTIKAKDNMLIMEKRGVPQERQGMTITPLPEEHQFKKDKRKPAMGMVNDSTRNMSTTVPSDTADADISITRTTPNTVPDSLGEQLAKVKPRYSMTAPIDPNDANQEAVKMLDEGEDLFFNKNRVNEAIILIEGAIQKEPRLVRGYSTIYHYYKAMNNHLEAIRWLKYGAEHNPESPEIWFTLGNAYADEQNHKEALAAFQKALDLGWNNASVYYNMGNSFGRLQLHNDAVEQFKKAVEIDSKHFGAWRGLVISYGKLRNLAKTREALRAMLKNNPPEEDRRWASELLRQLPESE